MTRTTIVIAALLAVSAFVVVLVLGPKRSTEVRQPPAVSPGSRIDVGAPRQTQFVKMGELTFMTQTGRHITTIDIEIAESDLDTQRGLMYRESMEPNQGMLFIFPDEAYRAFWMRNTAFSLDIIFADEDGKIVTIHERTLPFDESNYLSTAPAKYVVEVNAGFVERHRILAGDLIRWERAAS